MLTSRPTESTTALRLRAAGAGRVGPYEVLRELSTRAPGAVVAEARDPDGALWLLELVRCRSVASDAERAERQRHEKLLAQRTAELVSSGELVLSSHGGAELEHGERVLFWAFEHAELPFLAERLDAGPLDPLDAAGLGACLADRLVLRHARGRFDPLLSEHLVRLTPSGDPEPFGIPLAVASEWLAPSMVAARWAPEERAREEAEASGDLWRLGRILAATIEGRADVPSELRAVIAALLTDDPRARLASAELASQQLHAIARARPRAASGVGAVDGHPFAALLSTRRAAGVSALDPLAPIALGAQAPSERTTLELELTDERGRTTELVEGRRPSAVGARDVELPFALPDPLAATSWDVPTLAPQETTSEVTAGAQLITRAPAPGTGSDRAQAHLDEAPLLDPEAITRQAEPETPVPARGAPVVQTPAGPDAVTGRAEPARPSDERVVLIDRTGSEITTRTEPETPVPPLVRPVIVDPTGAEITTRTEPHTPVPPLVRPVLLDRSGGAGAEITTRTEPRTPVPPLVRPVIVESLAGQRITDPSAELPASERATERPRESARATRPEDAAVASEHATTLDGPPPWALRAASPVDRTAEERPKSVRSDSGALDPTIIPDTVVEPAHGPDAGRPRAAERTGPRPSDPPSPAPRATTPSGKPAPIDPIAASWAQPVLPAGESPWSEVVHPRGTHMRDRSSFPGFDDELPVAPRVEKRAVAFETVAPVYTPPAYEPPPAAEVDAELAEALKGIDKRRVVSGVLVALVIAGLFALLSRTGREPAAKPVLVASAANEITLESDPPGATVVAEPDGEVLGKTPLVFLVAPASDVSVFLVAAGREPVRLALPERGGLTAKLAPLSGADCVVRLDAPEGIELEGVEVDIGVNAERRIPGAAVVRAKPGQRQRGARIVRCPELGGAKEQELALERRTAATLVRVTAPEGVTAYVNGDPIGKVPASGRTSSAFSVIRVDDSNGGTEERIVPTPSEVDVRMPVAKVRPMPKLLAGEAADAEAERLAGLDAEASPKSAEPPKPKLSKAERVIRARQLAKAGTKHLAAGRITQARESLVECVDLDPGAADCHKTLGMLYRRARATFKAREHFTRYLELVPEAPDAGEIRKLLAQ